MDNYAIVDEVSKKMNAIHNKHAKKLLVDAGLDADEYKENPNLLKEKGYVFVHENDGDNHRFVIAKVVAEDNYSVTISIDLDTADIEPEKVVDELEK